MHFFKALTRGRRSCAIVVMVEYLRRVQSNRLHSSREGDTGHDVLMATVLLMSTRETVIRFRERG
jgi:hypothetical protein